MKTNKQESLEQRYYRIKAQKDLLEDNLESISTRIRRTRKSILTLRKAKWILTEAERLTQTYFKERVESLVTTVISSVFERNLKFKLDFVHKANRLQCISRVQEGSEDFNLEFDEAGGLLDLVSFGFRIALWSLYSSRSRETFVLDEPMRFVDQDESLKKTSRILRDISRELNFQLVIITHDQQLAAIADRVFTVTSDGTFSTVVTEGRSKSAKTTKRRIKRRSYPTTRKTQQ